MMAVLNLDLVNEVSVLAVPSLVIVHNKLAVRGN